MTRQQLLKCLFLKDVQINQGYDNSVAADEKMLILFAPTTTKYEYLYGRAHSQSMQVLFYLMCAVTHMLILSIFVFNKYK